MSARELNEKFCSKGGESTLSKKSRKKLWESCAPTSENKISTLLSSQKVVQKTCLNSMSKFFYI